jgi:valyl-tRNA synthetase
MKKISGPALEAVMNDEIRFYPVKFKNLYKHWMENIRDWCISRQLSWGHRIPAWYDEEGNVFVARNVSEAASFKLQAARGLQLEANSLQLTQDEDCLDTWFSSWLWPFEVFKGYSDPGNKDIRYYYPTNTLVTAPEIIFFWVARMIMAGFEYKGEKPFNEVYFTGIVRDRQGRKMSKSLGNSPDLLGLIDQYGADAVRFGIMISSPAGNDLLWDEASNEQGRNFINKMWNALKLVRIWKGAMNNEQRTMNNEEGAGNSFAVEWFGNRLAEVKIQVDDQFRDFRLSEALKTIYSLVWDDFCSWYLEWVKPGASKSVDPAVYEKTVEYFEELMQLLHPFMPFVTEEIYHQLKERGDDLVVKQFKPASSPNEGVLDNGALLKEVITSIRDARNKNQLKPREAIKLHIRSDQAGSYKTFEGILAKQVNAESVSYTNETVPNTITVVVQKDKFFIESTAPVNTDSQKAQLQTDLEYLKGFLQSVEKKLSNERFVKFAKPEVIENERKKKSDAEEKIRVLEESLRLL